MFEARLLQGAVLKKILDSIRELITEANFECRSSEGMMLQAMDSSHVSLVSLQLRSDGFEHFRCDRPLSLGMNLNNMAKMLKCCGNDDSILVKADDAGDVVNFTFESPNHDKVSEFELKLMDIQSENLGIPDAEYHATVRMPSAEFSRIVKDLSSIGDTVEITVSKDGVKFSTGGDIGSASVTCRQDTAASNKDDQTVVDMNEPVALTFALRYLNSFTKATPLSPTVTLRLSRELPVVVEYPIPNMGAVKYYLAPKIEDEDMEDGA